ncbi:MAG: hypothetical protein ACOC5F_00515 [Candidatus Aminicenantaceae bacterium]
MRGPVTTLPHPRFWICIDTNPWGSKGICPLGRRAKLEKGRQGAKRPLEGGKRSCSPSKELWCGEPLRRATPYSFRE